MPRSTCKLDRIGTKTWIVVNGYYVVEANQVVEFRLVRPGLFVGVAAGKRFRIEGERREWWLTWNGVIENLFCRSIAEAVRILETA